MGDIIHHLNGHLAARVEIATAPHDPQSSLAGLIRSLAAFTGEFPHILVWIGGGPHLQMSSRLISAKFSGEGPWILDISRPTSKKSYTGRLDEEP
jgi:hypothetical protein